MAKEQLSAAYLAGLFDGEGSLFITVRVVPRKSPTHALKLVITNTYKPILERIQRQFGGAVYRKARSVTTPPSVRECWFWVTGAWKAAEFLRYVKDDAIIKQSQIEVALEFQERLDAVFREHGRKRHTGGRHRPGQSMTSPLEIEARQSLKETLSRLNHGEAA